MIKINSYSITSIIILVLSFIIISCQADEVSEVAVIDETLTNKPWTNLEWNNNPENFQFAIVSDRTGGNRPGVFEQGIEKFNLLQPEFVISVGDLIGGYTENVERINKQWDEFDQIISRLEMPFFYVPGNHDITNQVMEDIWKQRLGPTYYHFVYKNVLFLALNGEEGFDAHRNSFYSPEQREYVRKTLDENPDVRWTIIFMHKPIWADSAKSERSGWSEIEEMLTDRKHTVFAGHHHSYKHYERNNTSYIQLATTGGGSGLAGPMYGQFDHIVWITLKDDGPVVANLMLEGIWDKEFSAEDIKNYLELTLKGKAVRPITEFSESSALFGTQIEFKAFNTQNIPMNVIVSFGSSENFSINPWSIERNVTPNSVEIFGASLKMKTKSLVDKKKLVKELNSLRAKYLITYDFEGYGKISVQGTVALFD